MSLILTGSSSFLYRQTMYPKMIPNVKKNVHFLYIQKCTFKNGPIDLVSYEDLS